ncbi:serine-rich adhesin for platelets [Nasonia vitripennis]|uniref:Transmembrane protein 151B n=1 Tax=Nasonia vitripennis TaxID=7425 RepID=A0A7M7H6P0_NASVI|nr:serine-rich adhesin for platelets [Nasonia vitripennis]
MMNRENEEQKPLPQSLCGALQKEANCKCLVLSVLIYGCLAAVTWCRCANVTKIVINFSTFPIRSTKYVSPCDDGYIYIPVAFMGMLYLVYLVECYHSPIRIDLLHAEGQSGVLAKLTQLRLAQPTIWWKAISYHYVRRKRQIMRYRNGDNFTTTQVYYERVNSHAATSFYFYDYCGSKDISKELVLDPKIPITKITLSKGFAFSNVRSATEFEEARSRFFAEQEFRDDYMEMREGLDLGCNFSPITLVAVLGNPWFTRSYVYWCLSALLLSWPLRIIIECNTQYVDYQVTKLFGVNYDTPTNIQIHTSASQLSAPGSYMLAPSYSEALLMEPAALPTNRAVPTTTESATASDMVPSYSEALLYDRATAEHQPDFEERQKLRAPLYQQLQQRTATGIVVCECPCHGLVDHASHAYDGHEYVSQESLQLEESPATAGEEDVDSADSGGISRAESSQRLRRASTDHESPVTSCASGSLRADARICQSCLNDASTGRRSTTSEHEAVTVATVEPRLQQRRRCIVRDYSEPDLRRSTEILGEAAMSFLRANGRSLENIMENDESENPLNLRAIAERAEALVLEESNSSSSSQPPRNTGAIPKRMAVDKPSTSTTTTITTSSSSSSRVTVNPIAEAVKRLPSSRSTYFCLKSILKQNRRRFTLVTPEELQSLTRAGEQAGQIGLCGGDDEEDGEECNCDGCRPELERPDSLRIDRQRPLSCQSLTYRRENSRTLIYASPIQSVCPSDPFGGRNVVPSENPPDYEEALNLPVLSRLRRSLTERDTTAAAAALESASSNAGSSAAASKRASHAWKHRRTLSTDSHQLATLSSSDSTRTALLSSSQSGRSETAISLPSYDGLTVPPDSHSSSNAGNNSQYMSNLVDDPYFRLDELALASGSSSSSTVDCAAAVAAQPANGSKAISRLTRSLTERRSSPADSRRHDRTLRKSFNERVDSGCRISAGGSGSKRTSINIETSL